MGYQTFAERDIIGPSTRISGAFLSDHANISVFVCNNVGVCTQVTVFLCYGACFLLNGCDNIDLDVPAGYYRA